MSNDIQAVKEYLASNHRAWGPYAGYGPENIDYVQAVVERIAELRADYKGDGMFLPPTHGMDDLGLCIECDARRIFMNETSP